MFLYLFNQIALVAFSQSIGIKFGNPELFRIFPGTGNY